MAPPQCASLDPPGCGASGCIFRWRFSFLPFLFIYSYLFSHLIIVFDLLILFIITSFSSPIPLPIPPSSPGRETGRPHASSRGPGQLHWQLHGTLPYPGGDRAVLPLRTFSPWRLQLAQEQGRAGAPRWGRAGWPAPLPSQGQEKPPAHACLHATLQQQRMWAGTVNLIFSWVGGSGVRRV